MRNFLIDNRVKNGRILSEKSVGVPVFVKYFGARFLRVLFFGSGQFLVKTGAFDTRVGALRDLEVDLLPFFLDSLMSIKRRFDVLMSIKRRLDVLLMLSDNVFK